MRDIYINTICFLGPSKWTTPLKMACRKAFESYYKLDTTKRYPSIREMTTFLEENEASTITVPQLRSHLQHDFGYVRKQRMKGRRLFD